MFPLFLLALAQWARARVHRHIAYAAGEILLKQKPQPRPDTVTVFAVAEESGFTGTVRWALSSRWALSAYREAVSRSPDSEVTLFSFDCAADCDPDQVMDLADRLMWARDYLPLQRREAQAPAFGV